MSDKDARDTATESPAVQPAFERVKKPRPVEAQAEAQAADAADARRGYVKLEYHGRLKPPFGVEGRRTLTHYVVGEDKTVEVREADASFLLKEKRHWKEAK